MPEDLDKPRGDLELLLALTLARKVAFLAAVCRARGAELPALSWEGREISVD